MGSDSNMRTGWSYSIHLGFKFKYWSGSFKNERIFEKQTGFLVNVKVQGPFESSFSKLLVCTQIIFRHLFPFLYTLLIIWMEKMGIWYLCIYVFGHLNFWNFMIKWVHGLFFICFICDTFYQYSQTSWSFELKTNKKGD